MPGAPVIDEAGVLGQVTRVYPLSSEVTLLVDKEAAIPVLNTRTHQRSAAFGADGAALELRFMAGNADVKVGDLLQTSGVDGIYPPGLDVAKVVKVDPRADSSFARIALVPTASADGVRHVLVLEPMAMQLPPRPAARARAGAAQGPEADQGDARSDHAARRRPAPAAGQPPVLWALAVRGARCSTCCRWAASRRCPTCWRSCSCSGTCTSRAASASAPRSSSAC